MPSKKAISESLTFPNIPQITMTLMRNIHTQIQWGIRNLLFIVWFKPDNKQTYWIFAQWWHSDYRSKLKMPFHDKVPDLFSSRPMCGDAHLQRWGRWQTTVLSPCRPSRWAEVGWRKWTPGPLEGQSQHCASECGSAWDRQRTSLCPGQGCNVCRYAVSRE